MYLNQKPSEMLAVLATIDPVSQAAGTITTGWIDAGQYHALMAVIQTGVLGASATVDAKLQQATDNGGTGVKDLVGKTITQIVKATGDNKQAIVNVKGADFDVEGGFRYARLSLTVGTAASLVGAVLIGAMPRMAPVTNQAGVLQAV